MSFSIIVSEKGGAERRDSFDKNEINVGRVQSNDLMLPKGNVSKHHARLLFRDGRFIVTDLKSTNGTYVNGRKITQATIVREGDKIYIGDFILRVDGGGDPASSGAPGEPQAMGGMPEPQRLPPGMPPGMPPLPGTGGPPPMPPGAMQGPPMPPAAPQMQMQQGPMPPPFQQGPMPPPFQQGPMPPPFQQSPMPGPMQQGPMPPPFQQGPMPGPMQQGPMPPPFQQGPMPVPFQQGAPMAPPMPPPQAPRTTAPAAPHDQVSHYPLERDPDDSDGAPAQSPAVPGPPRMPTGPVAAQRPGRGTLAMGGSPAPGPTRPRPSNPPPVVSPRPHTPSHVPPKETPAQVGRRLALMSLVDRVGEVVDVAKLAATADASAIEGVQRAAREQATGMREEGEVPEGVDVEAVVADAVREITGLGALGPLLENDEVTEIQCFRPDQVLAVRSGQLVLSDCVFTTEDALGRAIVRLAALSGQPLGAGELVIVRRLPKGVHMLGFLPPAASSPAVVLHKRRRADMSIEDFVRLGAMSRPMATFLEACVAARVNVLVAASGPHLAAMLVGALASAGSAGDRVVVLQDEGEPNLSHGQVLSLGLDNPENAETLVAGAARLRPDRMVFGTLQGRIAGAALDAIANGAEGVLAAAPAPSLRHALGRLVAQLILARPGVGLEAAREMVGEAFDVAIEATALPDGRYRVTRIAELAGGDTKGVIARDLFVAQADGPDGGHQATGVVPHLATELGARGIRLDPSLFKKGH